MSEYIPYILLLLHTMLCSPGTPSVPNPARPHTIAVLGYMAPHPLSVALCKWKSESWMVIVLNLQTDNTHKARVSIFVHIPTSYTYTNLYIFVPVHASIRCKPSFSCCSEYVYIAQNIFGFMTLFTDAHATEQNKSHPHSRKGLWPDLQDAMMIAFC